MNKYLWIFCVVGLAALGCASKVDVEQQKASLMAADSTWAQTTTDPEKLTSFFADDAALSPQGVPVAQGHDAIHQFITGMMATPGFALTWKATKADVSASGDLGYTMGAYEMTARDSSGTPMTEKGKFVTVWKKQADGQWKVVHDIFNADAPPPPPPPPAAKKKR